MKKLIFALVIVGISSQGMAVTTDHAKAPTAEKLVTSSRVEGDSASSKPSSDARLLTAIENACRFGTPSGLSSDKVQELLKLIPGLN